MATSSLSLSDKCLPKMLLFLSDVALNLWRLCCDQYGDTLHIQKSHCPNLITFITSLSLECSDNCLHQKEISSAHEIKMI